MRFQNILFILIIAVTFAGCNSCGETPRSNSSSANSTNANKSVTKDNNENSNVENTNVNQKSNNNSRIDDSEASPEPTIAVQAVVLKPIVEAYCSAMRKKDDSALMKIYSRKSLAAITAEMKKEGISSIAEYLDIEPVGNKCEVVNESIKGGTAEAFVITKTYPEGTAFTFEQENGEWKMTNRSSEIDSVDQK